MSKPKDDEDKMAWSAGLDEEPAPLTPPVAPPVRVTEDTKLRCAVEGITLSLDDGGRLTIHDPRHPHEVRFTYLSELLRALESLRDAGAKKWGGA